MFFPIYLQDSQTKVGSFTNFLINVASNWQNKLIGILGKKQKPIDQHLIKIYVFIFDNNKIIPINGKVNSEQKLFYIINP